MLQGQGDSFSRPSFKQTALTAFKLTLTGKADCWQHNCDSCVTSGWEPSFHFMQQSPHRVVIEFLSHYNSTYVHKLSRKTVTTAEPRFINFWKDLYIEVVSANLISF